MFNASIFFLHWPKKLFSFSFALTELIYIHYGNRDNIECIFITFAHKTTQFSSSTPGAAESFYIDNWHDFSEHTASTHNTFIYLIKNNLKGKHFHSRGSNKCERGDKRPVFRSNTLLSEELSRSRCWMNSWIFCYDEGGQTRPDYDRMHRGDRPSKKTWSTVHATTGPCNG